MFAFLSDQFLSHVASTISAITSNSSQYQQEQEKNEIEENSLKSKRDKVCNISFSDYTYRRRTNERRLASIAGITESKSQHHQP